MYKLRNVSIEDYDFIYNLNVITMKENVVKTWGWDEVYQKQYFKEHFFSSNYQIIQYEQKDIGVLALEQKKDSIHIIEIQILPTSQNKGIGTSILIDIIKETRSKRIPLKLRVLKVNNRARILYERLGFVIIDENDTHYMLNLK